MKVTIPKSQYNNFFELLRDFEDDMQECKENGYKIRYKRKDGTCGYLAAKDVPAFVNQMKQSYAYVIQDPDWSRFEIFFQIKDTPNSDDFGTEGIFSSIRLSKKLKSDTFWSYFREYIKL